MTAVALGVVGLWVILQTTYGPLADKLGFGTNLNAPKAGASTSSSSGGGSATLVDTQTSTTPTPTSANSTIGTLV